MTTTVEMWVKCPKPIPNAQLRLFCLPYAGGWSRLFHPWIDALPNVEVCPIELPGRGSRFRESPFVQLLPLVEALAQALIPNLDKPFAFFGHSMGALISFELTNLLHQKYGLSPVHLFISGRRAPQTSRTEPILHNLPETEFLAALYRLNGTPTTLLENIELRQLIFPLLRADFKMIETYEYQAVSPLLCPITTFGGLQDPEVSEAQLTAWQERTSATFSLNLLPGDHFFLHSAQFQLLKLLSQNLGRYM